MTDLLHTVGQVAGLGGLALGVFLLLFRRIRLPTATRRHLTLFMWLVWSIAVLGLVCYTISVLSASSAPERGHAGVQTIPTYAGDYFYVTYPGNAGFISFLNANEGRIVFLNTRLDASVSIEEQAETAEKEDIDLDRIVSGEFSGMPLPLPNKKGELVTVAFDFSESHVLKYSSGGTGVVTVGIRGFFEVSRTLHGGPTTSFHLKEVDAPLNAEVELLNREE